MVTAPAEAPAPLDLFYSYSHRDEDLRDELAKHLALLERRKIIRSWHDRKITAGNEWADKIDANLEVADIVLLLVSSDFIASDYCYEKEMKRALERHAQGAACTVPVIVRPCDWRDSDFGQLHVLPKDGKAVASWPMRDEAWTDVAKGIRKVVVELNARAPAPPPLADEAAPPPARTRGGRRGIEVGTKPDAARPSEPYYERALEEFSQRVESAIRDRAKDAGPARPEPAADRPPLKRIASRLASLRGEKRLLWVDDRPAGTQHEREALLGMQIEVASALGTEEALERVRAESGGFDLVISDWQPGPPKDPSLPEGLRFAGELRKLAQTPLVFYHGTVDQAEAEKRRNVAKWAGALDATANPGELVWLVLRALA